MSNAVSCSPVTHPCKQTSFHARSAAGPANQAEVVYIQRRKTTVTLIGINCNLSACKPPVYLAEVASGLTLR